MALIPAVPYGADQTLYLVVDAYELNRFGLQSTIEETDFETVVNDLISGQFSNPIRVIAFNTLEHWTADVSQDVAREIQCRCDIRGDRVPDYLDDFVRKIGLTHG